MSRRLAVVLFNLGGPDALESVQPFLFNLFNDKAIFNLPRPFRGWLAAFVAKRRAPIASEIYRQLGGGSPLLANTIAQADALHMALGGGEDTKVFVAMRYWHPFTAQTAADVQEWGPDEIILLPLYPQFSTTTAASSLGAWSEAAKSLKLKTPSRTICCYPTAPGFIAAMAEAIVPALDQAGAHGTPRLLLSAHGLPEKVVNSGDPYQYQCEQTAQAIVAAIADRRPEYADLDWSVCYQSRVGPLKWIQPSTDEGNQAGRPGSRAGGDRAHRVRFRAFGNAGRDRDRISRPGGRARRPLFSARAGGGDRAGVHRCARASGSSRAERRLRFDVGLRRPALPARIQGLSSCKLTDFIFWVKAFHVIAVIAWMAGMFYLPRLFVYHAQSATGSDKSETFKVMEAKLMRIIMMPAATLTWLLGAAMLALNPALTHEAWLMVKLAFVIGLTAMHFVMVGWRKAFAQDRNRHSEKFFRMMNEVPTLALMVIVVMVIVRPF